ncbi:MAG TPA: hypothetical protein VD999_02615 [Vitreimonas sp.]|nr:hypothetical protein [Vitreimonas sp.]
MINATPTPTSYTKQPVTTGAAPVAPATPVMTASGAGGGNAGGTNFKGFPAAGKQPRKIFGIDARSVMTVLGLTLFFVLSMAGVLTAIRQRVDQTPVAPTAPDSRPQAAVVQTANCSLSFVVAGSPSPSPSTSPSPSPSTSPSPSPSTSPSPSPSTSPSPSPSTSPSPSPTTTTTYSCNSTCQNNTQCAQANSNFICYNGNCRLATNPTSASCSTAYCNQACGTDSDCSNPDHACYDTNQGRVCRLESNPESASCTPPSTTTYVPTQTVDGTEPLPSELPRSGAADTFKKFIGPGLLAIVGGAVLALLIL